MYQRDIYTLLKKDLPKIHGKTILVDNNKGGEVLVYKVQREVYKEINIFKFIFKIITIRYNPKKMVFLRPFKKNWDTKKYKLSPVYWGKKNYPLTNLWCILNKDYSEILDGQSNEIFVKDYILNRTLNRNLKNHNERFIVEIS